MTVCVISSMIVTISCVVTGARTTCLSAIVMRSGKVFVRGCGTTITSGSPRLRIAIALLPAVFQSCRASAGHQRLMTKSDIWRNKPSLPTIFPITFPRGSDQEGSGTSIRMQYGRLSNTGCKRAPSRLSMIHLAMNSREEFGGFPSASSTS